MEELTSCNNFLEILHDPVKSRKLKMELAINIDGVKPFVKATYTLEVDGPLPLVAYERLSMLFQVIAIEHYPNVCAVSK